MLFLGNQTNRMPESLTVLQRIAKGDQPAVKECLDKYGKSVWFLARRFTKTREDAEDATQEIFIDIWKSAARFDPTKSPEQAFVMLISRRRLIDCLRKSKCHIQTSLFEYELAEQASEDHTKLHICVEMAFVIDALNKLGFHQKRIIKMSIYGGYSHSKIAQAVGLPLGTVKSQIRRGLQNIRNLVELPKGSRTKNITTGNAAMNGRKAGWQFSQL